MTPHLEQQLTTFFKGKTVLITGATGTMGQALAERIITYQPQTIRLFSRDEYKQYVLKQQLGKYSQFRFLIGDVRDADRVNRAMENVDIVLHTAAMKHVPICEYNPFEAIKTNVIGTQNVILAAIQNNVKHMLLTSSDKAIAPPNAMGATKLLAERLMTAAAFSKGPSAIKFSTVRFGNVLGSRGSAINYFIDEIRKGHPIKITNMNMTRFMMSIPQAVSLVLKSLLISQGGDVFVLKMPVIRLSDLAQVLLEEFGKENGNDFHKQIEIIGLRPGEKMYEELLSEEEAKNAIERNDMFIIPPWWGKQNNYSNASTATSGIYSSQNSSPITKEEIKTLLIQSQLLYTS